VGESRMISAWRYCSTYHWRPTMPHISILASLFIYLSSFLVAFCPGMAGYKKLGKKVNTCPCLGHEWYKPMKRLAKMHYYTKSNWPMLTLYYCQVTRIGCGDAPVGAN
jgi:hypothetical protein